MFKFPQKVLAGIKRYLENRQKETKKRVAELQSEDPFKDTTRLSDNASIDTEANEQIGHERIQALKKELENTQTKIQKSLEKIKKDKYGFCERCGKMIDTARLETFPMAEYCVQCERKKES